MPRDYRFHVYTPEHEPLDFETLEQAISNAKEVVEMMAKDKVIEAGGVNIRTLVEFEIKNVLTGVNNQKEMANWVLVKARASGKPYIENLLTKG